MSTTPSPAEVFLDHLLAEVSSPPSALSASDRQALQRYYRRLLDPARLPFVRYNWLRRLTPLTAFLLSLPTRPEPYCLLDAGCGFGTEALFFGWLRPDLAIAAVDISSERLALASNRIPYYAALAGRSLNIRFIESDIFSVLAARSFDIIWSMEAISHIDPAEAFLSAASHGLLPGGLLALSDSHRLNPFMLCRIARLRLNSVSARTHKTLSSGETIGYAQERLFSVSQLSHLLRRAGFTTLRSQLSIFFPPALARFSILLPFLARFDSALDRFPIFRNLGGIYTLLAWK